MAEYQIEQILDKRTRKGLIEYLIKWDGFDHSENTWELRKDLIADGCGDAIKAFDQKLKAAASGAEESTPAPKSGRKAAPSPGKAAKSAAGRSETPSRPRGRSSVKSPEPRSPTPKKTPRRSVSKAKRSSAFLSDSEDQGTSTSKTRKSVLKTATPSRAPRSSLAIATAAKIEDNISPIRASLIEKPKVEDDDEDVTSKTARSKMSPSNRPSPQSVRASPALRSGEISDASIVDSEVELEPLPPLAWEWSSIAARFDKIFHNRKKLEIVVSFAIVFLSMVVYVVSNNLHKAKFVNEDGHPVDTHLAVEIMKQTTFIPPLALLVLIVTTRSGRYFYCKWISVVFVWRAAGEVVLHLPSAYTAGNVYQNFALAAFGLSYVAILRSVVWVAFAAKKKSDGLMKVFAHLGFALLITSDFILLRVKSSDSQKEARFLLMGLGLISYAVAALLERAPKNKVKTS